MHDIGLSIHNLRHVYHVLFSPLYQAVVMPTVRQSSVSIPGIVQAVILSRSSDNAQSALHNQSNQSSHQSHLSSEAATIAVVAQSVSVVSIMPLLMMLMLSCLLTRC